MENPKRAKHLAIWGWGEIQSAPIWSVCITGYVVIFKPDAESFSIPVPVDELQTD